MHRNAKKFAWETQKKIKSFFKTESLDSFVVLLPLSAFTTTNNIKDLEHRLEAVAGVPQGICMLLL